MAFSTMHINFWIIDGINMNKIHWWEIQVTLVLLSNHLFFFAIKNCLTIIMRFRLSSKGKNRKIKLQILCSKLYMLQRHIYTMGCSSLIRSLLCALIFIYGINYWFNVYQSCSCVLCYSTMLIITNFCVDAIHYRFS